jgi:hypothetical protein
MVFLLGADKVGSLCIPTASSLASPVKEAVKATQLSNPKSLGMPLLTPSPTSSLQRRWGQAQAKDFYDLHNVIATLILSCNQNSEGFLHSEVEFILNGPCAPFYLQVLSALSLKVL